MIARKTCYIMKGISSCRRAELLILAVERNQTSLSFLEDPYGAALCSTFMGSSFSFFFI
jgi:hypothetical protein